MRQTLKHPYLSIYKHKHLTGSNLILLDINLFRLNIFYLYTVYIELHIKTYNDIQYANRIQVKVFRLMRICNT